MKKVGHIPTITTSEVLISATDFLVSANAVLISATEFRIFSTAFLIRLVFTLRHAMVALPPLLRHSAHFIYDSSLFNRPHSAPHILDIPKFNVSPRNHEPGRISPGGHCFSTNNILRSRLAVAKYNYAWYF